MNVPYFNSGLLLQFFDKYFHLVLCTYVTYASHQYLTNVQCCYRRFGSETSHPTQKFTSMNLLQMPCVITYFKTLAYDYHCENDLNENCK